MEVEFRNRCWVDAAHALSIFEFENEHQLVNVEVDPPQGMANSIPSVREATNPDLRLCAFMDAATKP